MNKKNEVIKISIKKSNFGGILTIEGKKQIKGIYKIELTEDVCVGQVFRVNGVDFMVDKIIDDVTKRNILKVLFIVVVIIGMGIGQIIGQSYVAVKTQDRKNNAIENIELHLKMIADETREELDLPKRVNDYISIENIEGGPGKRMTYTYKLNTSLSYDEYMDAFGRSYNEGRKELIDYVCNFSDMNFFIENHIKLIYDYYNNAGSFLHSQTINSDDCK